MRPIVKAVGLICILAHDHSIVKIKVLFRDPVAVVDHKLSVDAVYAGARTALTRTFDRTLPDLEPHSAGVKPHLSGSLPEKTSDMPTHMDSFIRICG